MPFTESIHRSRLAENVFKIVKKNLQRILFPEFDDPRILKACKFLAKNKIVVPVLLGNPTKIKSYLKMNKVPQSSVEIIDTKDVTYAPSLKIKDFTSAKIAKLMKEPIYLASYLLKKGKVDGLVYGAKHPTADTLRAALRIVKLKKGMKWASSYFIMLHEKRVFFFADCAFNIEPNADQLAQIAIATADSASSYGFTPKVAMLSFSTKGSAKHENSQKIAKATSIVKKKRRDIIIDGEMQFDAAVVPHVCLNKAPKSPIKGHANVLIFPDLNSGNIGYKIAQRFAHDQPVGPIVQGLAKPVNDLSRGCTVEEVIEVAAFTALQALRK